MNRYEYVLKLKVSVEAFDEDDADECIEDTFGVGADGGVDIKEMQVISVESS